MFNYYGVTATQPVTFVLCYNNTTLKMDVIAAETCCENSVNKIRHKLWSAF